MKQTSLAIILSKSSYMVNVGMFRAVVVTVLIEGAGINISLHTEK